MGKEYIFGWINERKIVWLLAIVIGFGFVIWSLGLWLGGCASTRPELNSTSSSTSSSTSMPAFTSSIFALIKFVEPSPSNRAYISVFSEDKSSGALNVTATLENPSGSFLLAPSGKLLYTTAPQYLGGITAYRFDPISGTLTTTETNIQIPPDPAGNPGGLGVVAFAPASDYLYSLNSYGPTGSTEILTVYSISSTGDLTSVESQTLLSSGRYQSVGQFLAIDPSGQYAYFVTTSTEGITAPFTTHLNLFSYNINQSNTFIANGVCSTSETLAYQIGICNVAMDPSGRFISVISVDGQLWIFNLINGAASLSQVKTLDYDSPHQLAYNPSSQYAYLLFAPSTPIYNKFKAPGIIQVFGVAQSNGALSWNQDVSIPYDPSSDFLQQNSTSIAVDPQEKFVYVAHSNPEVVYLYEIGTGGNLAKKSDLTLGPRPFEINMWKIP